MGYLVNTYSLGKINLAPQTRAEEILQNIAVILSTRKGSCPQAREIGLQGDFIDRPITIVQARIVAQVHEAIKEQEPRATVVDIHFSVDEDNPGRLIPTVEVEIEDESILGS